MPLARNFNGTRVVTTVMDGFLDRLSKWSDIQEYMMFLYETAKSYPNVRVLELGARKGNSTSAFLAAAVAVNGSVTSVDIDRVTDYPEMQPFIGNTAWRFEHGSDTDETVQACLPVEVDVLFIDTSHEYDHTLEELHAYMPRVAPGGVALFHDTNLFGWGGNPPVEGQSEVKQALDTYCSQTGLTWENLPGRYGLGMIRP